MTNSEKYKTAKERAKAFREWKRNRYGRYCMNDDKCAEQMFMWLDLETTAEEPLPCPFCGGEVKYEITVMEHVLKCKKCGYMNTLKTATDKSAKKTKKHDEQLKAELIAAHNRVARAVLKSKEMR